MKKFFYWKVVAILNWFAAKLLQKHQPKIIGITGSVGKTGTKRAVAAVVEQDFKTQWHEGNFNSEVGLPLALYELDVPKNLFNPFGWILIFIKMLAKYLAWPYPYELLVLELGIDKVGDMDRFLDYIKLDIGIVTAVQGAHLGAGLGTLDTVYQEKTKLATAAKRPLINIDDHMLNKRYLKQYPQTRTYGTHKNATYQATKVTQRADGYIEFTMGDRVITTKFIGPHSVLYLIAGWAAGDMLNINKDTMELALENLEPYPGRMNLFAGKRGSMIIDDTYNNVSVEAAKTAVDSLMGFPGQGRKILVMGTMNEMGEQTEDGHREVGRHIANSGVDYLITIGEPARNFLAKEAASQIKNVKSFMSPYDAGHFTETLLKKGDTVLVKGSQNGVFAEEATALLLKLESERSKLVRQSANWQKIKHTQFN